MACYSLADRFPPNPRYVKLLDPGAYFTSSEKVFKQNKAPFLSKAPRNTIGGNKLYTQRLYNTCYKGWIPNCTSMLSKKPRFPYEALSKEDIEEILCRCGIKIPCECPVEEEEEVEIICQAKVPKTLFKGRTPHYGLGQSISVPSKRHRGFEILPSGITKQILAEQLEECPPFYDARVDEATAFYQGCKWSQWKSKRVPRSLERRPGPADYSLERKPTKTEICYEKFREQKRMNSRQLRYIEIIQNQNILESRPGPSDYDPKLPKGTTSDFYGSKAERFPAMKYDVRPGPADHFLKRDFDPPELPACLCLAKNMIPAGFGSKAPRFKKVQIKGPSPAEYSVNKKLCNVTCCTTAPFGLSALRFKNEVEYEASEDDEENGQNADEVKTTCPNHTWQFRSTTKRLRSLRKKLNEPSPGDYLPKKKKIEKSRTLQTLAPFNSSEGRFQPWYDWLPMFGQVRTPGPCIYNLERYKCNPAVNSGPACRSPRFPWPGPGNPAPNEYQVPARGVDDVLATHNDRLKKNIKHKNKFEWHPPPPPRILTLDEKQDLLFEKAIALIDEPYPSDSDEKKKKPKKPKKKRGRQQQQQPEGKKLLRTFLYTNPTPHYF